MTMQESAVQPGITTSPYLRLRQAVRPAIFAHRLLAGDRERAGRLAAECEELLMLTRELVKAAGHVRLLGAESMESGNETPDPYHVPADGRQTRLLDAYADAGLAWAKVVGGLMALAGTLLDRGEWDDVHRLADVLAEAGENCTARDLRGQLAKAVWNTHRDQLQRITGSMPAEEIRKSIAALRAVLLDVPVDFPERNQEVNGLLAPLASSIHAMMKDHGIEITYASRVEHIAAGGVAKYPEIARTSLDELSAEFEEACRVISQRARSRGASRGQA
jgi:hypothetical protein